MIKSLRVRNLATIEDLEVRLSPGFTILTGETGAGKSIIIDAIRLLLGDKASAELIRTGTKECSIEAVFDSSRTALESFGDFPPGDGSQIFVQRQISESGTAKAYINGIIGPVRRLRELGPHLIDVYGQNDHVFLLHLDNHLGYLDAFVEEAALTREVRHRAQQLRALIQERRELEARERDREARLDFLDYQIREIESACLRPGEDVELLEARSVLKNAERIESLLDKALDLTYQGENSLDSLLARCQGTIEDLAAYAPSFREFQAGLEESVILVRDLADSLVRFRDRKAEAPGDPEDIEERLSLIEKLKRKHGGSVEAALGNLEAMKEESAVLAKSRERLSVLSTELEKKFLFYAEAARKLGDIRTAKAGELGRLIEKELALLGMKKARFEVRVNSRRPKIDDPETIRDLGTEEVEFIFSSNPGEEVRPLRKIASGGELSRIMLALKSVGTEPESMKTLIFDEIDAGIGGKTAECIAQKLRGLARSHQVLCITHLPQIAAAAEHHFRVDKKVEKDRTFTTVRRLSKEERTAEIALLIAGSRVTQASLQAAREMLGAYPDPGAEHR